GVEFPGWWDSPAGRLGARLRIESDPLDSLLDPGAGARGGTAPQLGLSALVGYHWEIALGDTTLTLKEFEDLASKGSPLVRIGGRWIEVRPEDVKSAIEFIRENPGGEMALAEAMRLAYSTDPKQIGLPILGLQASGWVASILGGSADQENRSEEAESRGPITVPLIETPDDFQGTLRPYQQRGLSWMAFLERFGFGGCLADDMGLGKTVQLLALLVAERSQGEDAPHPKPTLLIVPMSVVGNWVREARRFAPQLRFLVHHGIERLMGDDLLRAVAEHDVIVTTYALANRDKDILHSVHWGRVVVDEAQFIKNPQAKQSLAVRGLNSERRMALTGTPVENRLSELWSIMDFLNPGYLGPSGTFRKRFSVPIERYRDAQKAEQLRGLVRPFILRRVKTDPAVAADLPEKLETREYTHLSSEQAALYESCVNRMLSQVEESEGIQRRGLVLAALIR
ncbi:MAG: SNF2-related protein, partial [Planctomycetota bacterium]